MFRTRGLSFFNQRILNVDFNRRRVEGRKSAGGGGREKSAWVGRYLGLNRRGVYPKEEKVS